jgi:hypothetical protein
MSSSWSSFPNWRTTATARWKCAFAPSAFSWAIRGLGPGRAPCSALHLRHHHPGRRRHRCLPRVLQLERGTRIPRPTPAQHRAVDRGGSADAQIPTGRPAAHRPAERAFGRRVTPPSRRTGSGRAGAGHGPVVRCPWPHRANLPGDSDGGNVSRLTGPMQGRTLPTRGSTRQSTTTPAYGDTIRAG